MTVIIVFLLYYVIYMKLARHVARIGEKRSVYRVLVGKHEGKATRKTQT